MFRIKLKSHHFGSFDGRPHILRYLNRNKDQTNSKYAQIEEKLSEPSESNPHSTGFSCRPQNQPKHIKRWNDAKSAFILVSDESVSTSQCWRLLQRCRAGNIQHFNKFIHNGYTDRKLKFPFPAEGIKMMNRRKEDGESYESPCSSPSPRLSLQRISIIFPSVALQRYNIYRWLHSFLSYKCTATILQRFSLEKHNSYRVYLLQWRHASFSYRTPFHHSASAKFKLITF